VKPETTRGARKLLPRRKRGPRPDLASGAGLSVDPDFDPVEFAEFLEADEGPIPIDPGFRERLREQLWEIVRDRAAERRVNRRPPPRRS